MRSLAAVALLRRPGFSVGDQDELRKPKCSRFSRSYTSHDPRSPFTFQLIERAQAHLQGTPPTCSIPQPSAVPLPKAT